MTRTSAWLYPLLAVLVLAAGCDIVTEGNPENLPDFRPAGTVVINEVFTLPPTNPSFFSWIEFLNAGEDTVDVTFWTVTMTTARIEAAFTVEIDFSDSIPSSRLIRQAFRPDGFGRYDVPLLSGSLLIQPGQQLRRILMAPKDLRTVVNIENRLLAHTRYGPDNAPGDVVSDLVQVQGPVFRVDTLFADSTSVVLTAYTYFYNFFLATTEQLELKDETGRVVDVVRYGNYAWPGPGADPYPANVSIGAIPEYQSIARYAGGYSTGSTASDFYITSPSVRPVPHWYSALIKRR